jgi:hypothetical protein
MDCNREKWLKPLNCPLVRLVMSRNMYSSPQASFGRPSFKVFYCVISQPGFNQNTLDKTLQPTPTEQGLTENWVPRTSYSRMIIYKLDFLLGHGYTSLIWQNVEAVSYIRTRINHLAHKTAAEESLLQGSAAPKLKSHHLYICSLCTNFTCTVLSTKHNYKEYSNVIGIWVQILFANLVRFLGKHW